MLAYGYCRYSSDLQTEASIKQQKNELTEYAKKNNITIIKFYCDEAISGTKDTREEFQAMISDCTKLKQVQAVLVWKTDRFARNTQDSLFYKMKLEKVNIKLISITQPIDNSTPEGALMYTLLAGMDEYYSKNLASNVKRALKMNANNCQFNGGIPPLGYNIVDKKYIINDDEAKIVKEIFKLYLNGKGILEIASILNSKGCKTKKGKAFGKNSVYNIISNERYTGVYLFNKGTKHNHNVTENNEIRIEDGIPQIISKEIYQKAMNIRRKNKTQPKAVGSKNVYILSGLIYCGKCGGRYNGQTTHRIKNNKEYVKGWYACSNRNKLSKCDNHRIEQDKIESIVIDSLTTKILNGQTLNTVIEKIKIEYESLIDTTELTALKKKLKETQSEIDNVVNLMAKTGSDKLINKLEKLEIVEEDLKSKIEFINHTNNSISSNEIIKVFKQDISNLRSSSKEELKALVQKYVKRITIYDDKFDVEYTFTDVISSRSYDSIPTVATKKTVFTVFFFFFINFKKV